VRHRLLRALPILAVLPLALTACSGSSDESTVTQPSTSSSAGALANLLPADIKAKGKLIVGSDIAYAPVEFKDDSGKIVGIDPDLAAAIGEQLGIKLEFQNATFDGLITSLTSKRIDVIMSAMSDNKKRQASVDFIDYFNAGTSIIVAKGNPKKIQSLDDFCGQSIALQRGTTQDDVATEQVAKCKTAGKPLNVLRFDTDPEALLQIKQGRAVADMNDFPVAAYTAKTDPAFEVVGEQIGAGPYGIAVPKNQTALRDAIQKAVQALIDDGTYASILDKWQVGQGALKTATVNAGT
jgi:polar amino acid transport system substrate-binding protein